MDGLFHLFIWKHYCLIYIQYDNAILKTLIAHMYFNCYLQLLTVSSTI